MAGILRVDQANVDYIYAKTAGRSTYIPGHVVQVQQATFTSPVSTTSATLVSSGLSASITPISATSKILIRCAIQTYSGGLGKGGGLAIYRGSTLIWQPHPDNGTGTFGGAYAGSSDLIACIPMEYLDSPATASTLTYNIYFAAYTSTFQINYNGGGNIGKSTMILEEIAQ